MNELLLRIGNRSRRWLDDVSSRTALICAAGLLIFSGVTVRADQVEMQNGDRYVGKVLSFGTDVLVMDNEVLGKVKLPRGKVAQITLSAGAVPATPQTNSVAATKNLAVAPRPQIKPGTNVIQQVQDQYLGDATPEAKAKYQQLAGGLMSGKVSVADIRIEAKSAADQLRKLKADLGEEGSAELDGYLAILDDFLNESKSSPAPATKTKSPTRGQR